MDHQINFYLTGLIYFLNFELTRVSNNNNNRSIIMQSPSPSPSLIIDTGIVKTTTLSPHCSECNIREQTRMCLQCQVYYCGKCFRKVHSMGRALNLHEFVPSKLFYF